MITPTYARTEAEYRDLMLADAVLIRKDYRRAPPSWTLSASRHSLTEKAVKLRNERATAIAAFIAANGPIGRIAIATATEMHPIQVFDVLKYMKRRGTITEARSGQKSAAVWSLMDKPE